jgi:outer membrane protein assembly factor BamB
MSNRRPVAVVVLGLSIVACSDREPRLEPLLEAELPALVAIDLRPDAGRRTIGDDITELSRAQNVKGKEPALPTRKGTMGRTRGPIVRRTESGFVAHIPLAGAVHTPAFHQGKIYAGSFGTYVLHALEAETGRSAWSIRLSDDGPTDPACEDGICVFNTYSCTTFAVDAETGKHLWSWYLGSPQLATAVIAAGAVFTSYPDSAGPDGAKYVIGAFDLKKGTPLWRRWIDAEVHSTPVVHAGKVWVATRAGTLYEFGTEDGAVLSAHRNRIASPPVLAGDAVLFARDAAPVAANDMLASPPLFPELEKSPPQGPVTPRPRPLVADHRLLTVENDVVVAVNRKNGRRLWQRSFGAEAPANISAPMLVAGEDVLFATKAGNIMRVDSDTGEVTDRFELAQGAIASQPIAVAGWLYAGTTDGKLVGFDTGQPELTGWEMLGGGPARQGSVDPEGT